MSKSNSKYEKDILISIASRFCFPNEVLKIEEISSGKINKTFLVIYSEKSSEEKFILQRISKIFNKPEITISNNKLITKSIKSYKKNFPYSGIFNKWQLPDLISDKYTNQNLYKYDDHHWRAMNFIKNSRSFESIGNKDDAKKLGIGLACFHSMTRNIDVDLLESSIDNFHDLRFYLDKFNLLKSNLDYSIYKERKCFKFICEIIKIIDQKQEEMIKKYNQLSNSNIHISTIHGDPKVGNFMFDYRNNVVSMIDLDTIQKGFLHLDIADCIRSSCVKSYLNKNEEYSFLFDIDLFESFLLGYFSITYDYFLKNEIVYISDFVSLIIFELATRFIIDFMEDGNYFKKDYYTHNLVRARKQLQILSSFETQQELILKILNSINLDRWII